MSKKKGNEHESHDKYVRALAEELKADKWDVKAILKGTEKPSKIGVFTPDIEAHKGNLRRICEA